VELAITCPVGNGQDHDLGRRLIDQVVDRMRLLRDTDFSDAVPDCDGHLGPAHIQDRSPVWRWGPSPANARQRPRIFSKVKIPGNRVRAKVPGSGGPGSGAKCQVNHPSQRCLGIWRAVSARNIRDRSPVWRWGPSQANARQRPRIFSKVKIPGNRVEAVRVQGPGFRFKVPGKPPLPTMSRNLACGQRAKYPGSFPGVEVGTEPSQCAG
jgi:hypothetical protein